MSADLDYVEGGTDNVIEIPKGERYRLTDNGIIDYFLDRCGDDWRYSDGLGWLYWTGTHWERDAHKAPKLRQEILGLIRGIPKSKEWNIGRRGESGQKSLHAFARNSESTKLNAIVGLANRTELYVHDTSRWDAHKELLPCLNGTVDLTTGRLIPSDREHYFTRVCPVEYDPDARAPRFEKFLSEAVAEKVDRVWMQQVLGACTLGKLSAQEFYVFAGGGSNGKGTLMRVLSETLGDFVVSPPASLLVGDGSRAEGPTPILLMLRGARGAFMQEPKTGAPLNSELAKKWTGEDLQTARDLNAKPITFTLQATPLLATNSIPRIDAIDDAIIRRIRVYQFTNTFYPDAKRSRGKSFEDGLLEERQGVLAWLVRGAVMNEFFRPVITPGVEKLTREVVKAQDEIGQFFGEECVFDPGAKIALKVLAAAYNEWRGTGSSMSAREFNKRLGGRPGLVTGADAGKVHGGGQAVKGATLRPEHPFWTAAEWKGLGAPRIDTSQKPTNDMNGVEPPSAVVENFLGSKPELVAEIGALADLMNAPGARWSDIADQYDSDAPSLGIAADVATAPAPTAPAPTAPAPTAPTTPAPTTGGGKLSHQCRHLGDRGHRECQRNRAKNAPLALECSCSCHDQRGDRADQPTPAPAPAEDVFGKEVRTAVDMTDAMDRATSESVDTEPGESKSTGTGWNHRKTVYVDWKTGQGITDYMDGGQAFTLPKRASLGRFLAAIPEGTRIVYLTGTPAGGADDRYERWSQGALPEGWTFGDKGEFVGKDSQGVSSHHYRKPGGSRLTLNRTGPWLRGYEQSTTPEQLAKAFDLLRRGIGEAFNIARPDTVPVTSTPAYTGLLLARWTMNRPDKRKKITTYPEIDAETRALIKSTSGQHRYESNAQRLGDTVPALLEYDLRSAYPSILTSIELPIGPATRDDRNEFLGHTPARYRATVTVPEGWNRIGLVGTQDADGGTVYPRTPGDEIAGWFDARELVLCQSHGWAFEIHERITFAGKSKPLALFGERINRLKNEWLPNSGADAETIALADGFVRDMCLQMIGALQGNTPPMLRRLPKSRIDELPEGVTPAMSADGKYVTWYEQGQGRGFLVRPEWCAAIWARCRVRVLENGAHDKLGALAVDPLTLAYIYADAIYTTEPQGWSEPDKLGVFRLKSELTAMPDGSPIPTPRTRSEVDALKALMSAPNAESDNR